jgi:hypothetical protein
VTAGAAVRSRVRSGDASPRISPLLVALATAVGYIAGDAFGTAIGITGQRRHGVPFFFGTFAMLALMWMTLRLTAVRRAVVTSPVIATPGFAHVEDPHRQGVLDAVQELDAIDCLLDDDGGDFDAREALALQRIDAFMDRFKAGALDPAVPASSPSFPGLVRAAAAYEAVVRVRGHARKFQPDQTSSCAATAQAFGLPFAPPNELAPSLLAEARRSRDAVAGSVGATGLHAAEA